MGWRHGRKFAVQDWSYKWITKLSMNNMYWVELQMVHEYFSLAEDVTPFLKSAVDLVSFKPSRAASLLQGFTG